MLKLFLRGSLVNPKKITMGALGHGTPTGSPSGIYTAVLNDGEDKDITPTVEGLDFYASKGFSLYKTRGGPDVTGILNRTLQDINDTFGSGWTPSQKIASAYGCNGNGWDIWQLRWVDYGANNYIYYYQCGIGDYECTVGFQGKVYYASAVNYAEYGKMFRLLHDYEDSCGVPSYLSSFTLDAALSSAGFFKLVTNFGFGEAESEALDFVEYGYTGTLPSDSTGLPTISSGETVDGDKFDWRWWPNKP